jgi:hypothetical protein
MNELLNPNFQDIRKTFKTEFQGMATKIVKVETLEKIRDGLPKTILGELKREEKEFILSVKSGSPDWSLMPLKGIDRLPAIKWKVKNIKAMLPEKHKHSLDLLRGILNE